MSPAITNATITLTSEVENIMGMLVDILDRETDAVKTSNFGSFREIQNDKFAILNRYRSLMETLQRQTDTLSRADPKVIERLRISSDKFKLAAKRNTEALESGRNSMQRIVDRIIRCARESLHGNRQSYNKKGQSRGETNAALSLQINEVL